LGAFGLHFGFLHFDAIGVTDVTFPEPAKMDAAAVGDMANPENPNPAISIAPATFNNALFMRNSFISPARWKQRPQSVGRTPAANFTPQFYTLHHGVRSSEKFEFSFFVADWRF
jgi:hypothetical protein